MKELTYKNHFKYGYNDHWFNERMSPLDQWIVTYGSSSRKELNFHDECIETAKLIKDNTDLPITVCLSGGADSEIVVRSFHEAKIDFKVAILRFKNDLNIHDISYGVILCESLSIPYKFIDLDILKFWENDMWDLAEKTRCITPQLVSTMWLVSQIDDYAILGSGECYIVKDIPKDYVPGVSPYERSNWYMWEKEKVASWYRHFMVTNHPGSPGFFQYTPEIMLSFLKDDTVYKLVNDEFIGKLSTMTTKTKIYKKYFNIIDRPKYTGFEKIMNYDKIYRSELERLYGDSNQVYKTEYNDLVGMLSK